MTSPDAYDSAARPGSGPVYTRVYLPGGRVAHLREDDSRGLLCPFAAGRFAWEWLGTGSQAEYDKAATLPLCPRCFAVRERSLPDPRLGTGHRVDEEYRGNALRENGGSGDERGERG